MANIHDISRDQWMLRGPLAKRGYDWWWHSMTAENAETGELKPFYVEFFTCNPALAEDDPVIVPGKDLPHLPTGSRRVQQQGKSYPCAKPRAERTERLRYKAPQAVLPDERM